MPLLAAHDSEPSSVLQEEWRAETRAEFPCFPDLIPPGTVNDGPYVSNFATERHDFDAVQRLRYRSVNELFGSSKEHAGRRLDVDAHDSWFHHLIVRTQASGEVVGTLRLQTASMAASRIGFHAATLFDLTAVPESIQSVAIEIGTACVDADHRNEAALGLLWRGAARYMVWNSARYAFGHTSLMGTTFNAALDAWKTVHARRLLHDRVLVQPWGHARALVDHPRTPPLIDAGAISSRLPLVFESCLALGARVCSAPAFNRALGTTDFLMLLEVALLDDSRATLFRAA